MDDLLSLHHDGVFLRREALEHGYDDSDLIEARHSGVISRIRHGAYVDSRTWRAANDVSRHRLRAHAVVRSHSSALALSHTSAAAEHGLWLHRAGLERIHVLCLEKPLGKTTPDIVYHRRPLRSPELVPSAAGVLCTSPLDAALRTAALHDVPTGVVVLDSVVHLTDVDEDGVRAAAQHLRGPGTRKLHVTVRLVRDGIESPAEALTHYLCWSQHLPEPVFQFEVRDETGTVVARVDFAWPEHGLLGEFDGVEKYHRHRRPGESIEQMVLREKDRENRIRELTGWLLIRLVWGDLQRPGVTGARIRAQLERAGALVR